MQGVTLEDFEDLRSVTAALERFPIRLTRKLLGAWPESALDSMFVAFPIGKPVSTFPGNALAFACGGMWVGQAARLRLSPVTFQRGFRVGLLMLGLYLVARSFV